MLFRSGGTSVIAPTAPDFTTDQALLLDLLRQRTDKLVYAMAAVDGPEIRKFFPPQADVHVGRQMAYYLDVPLHRMRILSWSGQAIAAETVDRFRAVTAVRLTIQHGRDLPREIPVVFYWHRGTAVDSRDPGNTYYLVPLEQAIPKPLSEKFWPADHGADAR